MSLRNLVAGTIAAVLLMLIQAPPSNADTATKHVFELFTSQGCYSCPPADELLSRIADRNEEILALEFHVDYWDTLVYGTAGQWKDPFSSPEYSQRQRAYSRLSLSGRTGVYTPQIVVDGAYSFVGSQTSQAEKQLRLDSRLPLQTSARVAEDGHLTIRIDGEHSTAADVWLVSFDKRQVTEVKSGENMGKKLRNSNIVRNLRAVGEWQGKPVVIEARFEPMADNRDCAVIIQEYSASQKRIIGPILGAAKCRPS